MIVIVMLYALLAATFVLAKLAVGCAHPFLVIGIRMVVAGSIFILGLKLNHPSAITLGAGDWKIFFKISFFHIYLAFVLEFLALQSLSSSMTNLIYSSTPFITALLSYLLLGEKLSVKKSCALGMGLAGLLPIFVDAHLVSGSWWASFTLFVSVFSSAYAWFDIRQLMNRGYSLVWINGFAMLVGGVVALFTGWLFLGKALFEVSHPKKLALLIGLMILLSNGIFYHAYGWLMQRYSLTFLTFAGFLSPFFGLFYGNLWLGEPIDRWMVVGLLWIVAALYIFYQDELKRSIKVIK